MNNENKKNYEMNWGFVSPVPYNDDIYGPLNFELSGSCKYTTNNENNAENEKLIVEAISSNTVIIVSETTVKDFKELANIITNTLQEKLTNFETVSLVIDSIKVDNVKYTEESLNKINQPKVVQTDVGNENGQTKCPKCGSTDISTNTNNGKLRCNFCRCEFEPEKVSGFVEDISKLHGQVMGSGAQDIVADTNDVLTFKCSSCGAEVVIDTASAPQARCHWCRNTLSVNEQIPNGAIPDVVLPFTISKNDARAAIEKFVGKRKFFAHPTFKKEFTTENIMGVYFPYMLVDVNAHANLVGEGEHQTRKYYVKHGDKEEPRYDADLYHVERDFDITINGLSVESSSDRLNTANKEKTNNIINSIMPFDTQNCVKYNANYLKGYTSEKRDTNVNQLSTLINVQSKDIARHAANDTLKFYDRGVKWDSETLNVKGQQWQAAYLPVWLYSYQQVKGNKKMLHYVAVNARTKETMGSVPIHMPKLVIISLIVEIIGLIIMIGAESDIGWLFIIAGIIYFLAMLARYRNAGARHTYEKETKREMTNIKQADDYIKARKGLSNPRMIGANNTSVNGANAKGKMMNSFTAENIGNTMLNSVTNSNPLASAIKSGIDKKNGK